MHSPVIVVLVVPQGLTELEHGETLALLRNRSAFLESFQVLASPPVFFFHDQALGEGVVTGPERLNRLLDLIPAEMGLDSVAGPLKEGVIPEDRGWTRRPPRTRIPTSQVRGHIQPRFRRP